MLFCSLSSHQANSSSARCDLKEGQSKKLMQDFLFLLNMHLSCDLGDVLTLLGFV